MQQMVEEKRMIKNMRRQIGSDIPVFKQRLATTVSPVHPWNLQRQPTIPVSSSMLRPTTPSVKPMGLLPQPTYVPTLARTNKYTSTLNPRAPEWSYPVPQRTPGTHPRAEYMFDWGKYNKHYFTEVPVRHLKSIGKNPNVVGGSLHAGLYEAFVQHRPDLLFTSWALRNQSGPRQASQYPTVNDTTRNDTTRNDTTTSDATKNDTTKNDTTKNDTTMSDAKVNNTMAKHKPYGGLPVSELLAGGVTIAELLEADMDLIDIMQAGVTLEQLVNAAGDPPHYEHDCTDNDSSQVPSSSSSFSPSSSGPAFSTPPHGHICTMPSSPPSVADSPREIKAILDNVSAYYERRAAANNRPRIAAVKIKIEKEDSVPAKNTRGKGKSEASAPSVEAGPSVSRRTDSQY
jgi:hypothetical protein